MAKVERLKKSVYEAELFRLQAELVKMQEWVRREGERVVVVFEGRDAAGKGSAIKRVAQYLNPRIAGSWRCRRPPSAARWWYFQRYVEHLPAAGEIVLFDRSWYNRAGSSGSWATARPRSTSASCGSARSSSGCWSRTASGCTSTGSR